MILEVYQRVKEITASTPKSDLFLMCKLNVLNETISFMGVLYATSVYAVSATVALILNSIGIHLLFGLISLRRRRVLSRFQY